MVSKTQSKKNFSYLTGALLCASFLFVSPDLQGKEQPGKPFMFLHSYKNVRTDPDRLWVGDDLSPRKDGTVSIYEYELRDQGRNLLISQIWNDNCSISDCPTRVFRVDNDGSKKLLIDDMMHQVIPEDDDRFRSEFTNQKTDGYAKNPFMLSAKGDKIVNSNYKFDIAP